MAAWVGRKPRGTTGVPWWKPISAAGNGSSVMRCVRKPTSVKQPKWHLPSTSSTACWRWDARATSSLREAKRAWDHRVEPADPCNKVAVADLANLDGPACRDPHIAVPQRHPRAVDDRLVLDQVDRTTSDHLCLQAAGPTPRCEATLMPPESKAEIMCGMHYCEGPSRRSSSGPRRAARS